MGAVDPTYPLYPIACILASAMLLLVLMTSFVRQSWNLGVTFLCFWLFLELVGLAVNSIVWSDNAELRLYVYCDIVTHVQHITFVVKPMATLIISRRLYLIASLQSVELPSKAARRWNLALEWTLGLIIPLLVAGPVYYANQGSRFVVYQGSGCGTAENESLPDVLIEQSWSFVPCLVSVVFYYPKVVRTYYRQRRDINSFLHSDSSVTRTNYVRILALASIDIMLTLPIGIVNIALDIVELLSAHPFKFYPGWTYLHSQWGPVSVSYAELQAFGTGYFAQFYVAQWSSPILAFAIFALFGVTHEARASYCCIICTVGGWFGWKPKPRTQNGHATLGEIVFGARPQSTSGFDPEAGSSTPSFIDTGAPAAYGDAERALKGRTAHDTDSESSFKPMRCIDGGIVNTDVTGDFARPISEIAIQEKAGTCGSLATGIDGDIGSRSTPGEHNADTMFGDSDTW